MARGVYTRRGKRVRAAVAKLKQALDLIASTDPDAAATIAGAVLNGDTARATDEVIAWGARQVAA